MKSLLASVRATGGFDRVDHAVQLLEDEWRKHGDAPLERLWADQRGLLDTEVTDSLVLLSELVKTDLRCRFARGQGPAVADYLERFPELGTADSRVLSLIYEEFCLTEERGGRVDVDAFCARYPRWKESLVSQLQYHHLFSQAAGVRPKAPPFPEPGDIFEEFQLVSLLGKGGSARVFLAKDLSLGGKQVVLKVSPDRGREPQAQGALDHPHIVPVNSVVFADDGMRGLSMPYRPGLPLDDVIRRVEPAARPARALALWKAIAKSPKVADEPSATAEGAAPSEDPSSRPKGDGWDGFPARGTYAQGVAWVVKVVAEALHYAHTQQTFHRDVKPANILLTLQHGPQLLDFNLAESPHSASQAQAAMHGGTLPYMAPEQIEAFLNPDLWGKVGPRADIYSLGLVLRELLTGQAPDLPAETLAPARAMRVLLDRRPLLDVSVRRSNPAIPHALEAIVAKCLSVPVDGRYPDAGALAEDLGRFLRREPPLHAANPSRRERCVNWVVRRRRPLSWAAAFLASQAVVVMVVLALTHRFPLNENPQWLAAIEALNAQRASDAVPLLETLVDEYPHSVLPPLYLGFALDPTDPAEAERLYGETLRSPGATKQLTSWSALDPRLEERLADLVRKRTNRAEGIWASREKRPGEKDEITKPLYRLSKRVLEVTREIRKARGEMIAETDEDLLPERSGERTSFIRPDAMRADHDWALAAQELGDYEGVIEAADRAIKRLNFESDPRVHDFESLLRIFQWRLLKSRALTKWAQRLRAETPAGRPKEAIARLGDAEKELVPCRNFASNERYATVYLHALERIRVVILMTRVEAELDLGDSRSAEAHLGAARISLAKFDDLAHRASDARSKEDFELFSQRLHRIEGRFARGAGAKPAMSPDLSRR